MTNNYRYIGKKIPRKDAKEIVTGKAAFFDDIKMPDMLIGKTLRSPYPHANIQSIDTRNAENLPGVKAVLTYKNIPPWTVGIPPHIPVLDRRLRYVGDAVALVAAETREIAEAAIELIEVEYEPLEAVYDLDEAIKPEAPQLYDFAPQNMVPDALPLGVEGFEDAPLHHIKIGNVEKGFQEADIICQGTCSYDGIPNPLPPEPPGIIVKWEGPEEAIVWSATQSPSWANILTSMFLNFTEIRSIATYCGGSYGSKNMLFNISLHAAALAKATNRPVKIYYTKAEHLNAFVLRPASRIHGKIGMKKDGTLTAIQGDWLMGYGANAPMGFMQLAVGCGEAQLALRCKNWDFKAKCVLTNRTPSGIVRGFGGQELKSSLMPILSIAMREADIDPLEFFKKNYVKDGDGYYWRDSKWHVCEGMDYRKAMEKGGEAFGWKEKWKGWLKPTTEKGTKKTGVGVSLHGNADVGEDRSEAYVRLMPSGEAVVQILVAEAGMGQRDSLCKMVAEVLQIPLEKVKMTPPDSLVNPVESGLVGSRGTYACGTAVIAAAQDARKQLLEKAAEKFNTAAENMDTADGMVFQKDKPEQAMPWFFITGPFQSFTGFGRFNTDFTKPNFMMIFTEVEVDVETGKIEILKVLAATDAGQIINPLALKGQIRGSLGSAGIDTAIMEESVIDPQNGHIMTSNMIDYKWRTFAELPEFDDVILESQFPTHQFKAIGLGEISTAPTPAAVLMAVSNAVGKQFFDYPLTPDKILRALGKIQGAESK
ncbi:MAG TPA: xanthine dehydrogenase family protein molybdopterin-binding subunit [Smithella sp.]|nr:xanthine dehydrogenase family protein molybdopterin-binding subunit [Smithella sp.]HOG91240.1 xanthine dehydrogenase family protein molybdopterin-binding subunit [Smithella sp.]